MLIVNLMPAACFKQVETKDRGSCGTLKNTRLEHSTGKEIKQVMVSWLCMKGSVFEGEESFTTLYKGDFTTWAQEHVVKLWTVQW